MEANAMGEFFSSYFNHFIANFVSFLTVRVCPSLGVKIPQTNISMISIRILNGLFKNKGQKTSKVKIQISVKNFVYDVSCMCRTAQTFS